ncbi:hypothetical protein MKZ38_003258 [Zalerion maritima]|uniref:Spindle pole body component n=1 Tax=Zalerion maritima TaxID=339359 RepID=A0AAD5RZE0_9PEZI|nr:hypothetical protein MKZ38_003258 [Zalerion maritima]
MSSASTRASAHSDRRTAANGTDSHAHRPRVPTNSSFKGDSEREGRGGPMNSPQLGTGSLGASTAHKRSASGNPRPLSRAAVGGRGGGGGEDDNRSRSSRPHSRLGYERERDRKVEERERERERRHETGTTTVRETLYYRTKSPERRSREKGKRTAGGERESVSKGKVDPKSQPKEQTPKDAPQVLQPKPLGELTLEAQEASIVEDLLFVFMGFEGQYVHFSTYNPDEDHDRLMGPSYKILPGLDPSLLDLTNNMLQMASHYSSLEAFIDVQSRDEMGSVSHALCASVRKLLNDYLVMIAQLETQFLTNDKFTLHILNIHTLPTAQMLSQLYQLAIELLRKNSLLDDESEEESDESLDNDKFIDLMREGGGDLATSKLTKKVCKGGGVLELVTKRLEAMSGDPAAKALLTSLLRDASRPYMLMLNEWLHHGGIKDPHAEFLIKESKSIRRDRLEEDYTDEYWERRYALKKEDIPPQLRGVAGKIHLAGKYLNVVRECGGVDVSKEIRDVPTSFDDQRLLENVNGAYASANDSLMQLLLTTHQLPARLRSLKHYFFLDPSDYFSHFLDLAHSELREKARNVNVAKLQSLLDLVLRQPGSVVSLDPFKDSVKLEIDEVSLVKRLQRVVNISGLEIGEVLQLSSQGAESDQKATGYTSLQLDYAVPFPVSLVISRKTIWRYQTLFRHLLSLRALEGQLSNMWQSYGRAPVWSHRSSERRIEIFKRRAWTLRSRMLVFVQQMLYFCTAEVIEPNWQALMGRLKVGGAGAASEDEEKEGPNGGGMPRGATATVLGILGGFGEKKGPTRTVDELMQDHVDFLDTCLKECMLTNSKLLRINNKLTQTCTYYAHLFNQFSRDVACADPDLASGAKPKKMTEKAWREVCLLKSQAQKNQQKEQQQQQQNPANSSQAPGTGVGGVDLTTLSEEERISYLYKDLARWESFFSMHLQKLMDALNHYAATETVVLLSLCARLSTVNQGTEFAGMGKGDAAGGGGGGGGGKDGSLVG